jgi:AcrR family transcriptional regulator
MERKASVGALSNQYATVRFEMPRKTRHDWIRAGLRRLARHAIDGVRVEVLAKDLGVTKGSFYWHFSDRAELLEALLEEWAETATEAVIALAEAAGSDPHRRRERLTVIATEGFDADLESALRDWGRHDAAAGRVLAEIDRRRLDYLRQLLRESGFEAAETEARAFLMYAVVLANHQIPDAHGRFSRKRILRESFDLLASPTSQID